MNSHGNIYIGLGTNMGDRMKNLLQAYSLIEERIGKIVKKSSVYVSPPWGFSAKDDFYNSVVALETNKSPETLMQALKEIEGEMGRVKTKQNVYESRIIDLDILDYKSHVIHLEHLRIPHPCVHLRRFVLVPLMEICPDWKHPETGQKITSLILTLPNLETIDKLPETND